MNCVRSITNIDSHLDAYQLEPPKVIQRPDSVIQINRGESLSIKCGFRGRPDPSISWLHNGQELILNGSPVTGKKTRTRMRTRTRFAYDRK